MFLPFLVLVFFAGPVITAKVPVCTGLRYTGTFVSCETGKEFYSYGFDLSVSINPNNSTFPNKLRITNYENWSSDPDIIYPGAPIIFPTKGVSIQCSTINETCLLDFPNGSTQMLYPLMVNESLGYPQSNAAIFINNGNVFDAYYGGLLDPILGDRLGWNDRKFFTCFF
uniref:Uncharacterized protein n=1 Tax=Panagrolaimus davidi TaxID=227884 RepID=A0A914PPK5_9BILA